MISLAAEEALGAVGKVRTRPAAPEAGLAFEAKALCLEYPLLGPRQYTHGSSMFQGMMESLRLLEPELEDKGAVINEFKVIRQFNTLSRAEAMETKNVGMHPRLGEAVARMDLTVAGRCLTSLLFQRSEPALGRLPEYDPAGYIASLDATALDGPCGGRLHRIHDMVDLVRGVNECNRQLTVKSFPSLAWSPRVRWAFVNDFPLLSSRACAEIDLVLFAPPKTVDVGRHRFEIKQGWLKGATREYPFSICFFIELPQGD